MKFQLLALVLATAMGALAAPVAEAEPGVRTRVPCMFQVDNVLTEMYRLLTQRSRLRLIIVFMDVKS